MSMTYDGLGRLLSSSVTNAEAPSLDASYSYEYTLTGNRAKMTSADSVTSYIYMTALAD